MAAEEEEIKIGSFVTIRAWPNNSIYLPRKFINQFNSEPTLFESVGYRKFDDYYKTTDDSLIRITLKPESGTLVGLVVSFKASEGIIPAGFYEILLTDFIETIWFPSEDVFFLDIEKSNNVN